MLLPARSSPAPWGGGLYEACGHRSRSAVRGSGVSSLFSYLVACRRAVLSLSCRHRLPPVSLLASSYCSRCLVVPYLLDCLASLRDSVSAPASPVVSRLIRLILFSLACLRVVIAPRPLASRPPPCSRVVSYRSSPRSFDEPGGAFLACLPLSLRLSSPLSRFPHSLRSSPCLLVLRVIALVVLVSVPRRRRLAHVLLPSRSSLLPVFRQAWAGSVSARYFLRLVVVVAACCCLLGSRFALVSVRRGRLVAWVPVAWRRCCRAVSSDEVVFGLWCRCLYI